MTIGEKIEKLRKENNLTQEQFAEVLHVSRQSVSKWELDTTYPETDKLIKMSKIFNCSLDYLLKDEIENMDVNLESSMEDARYNKILSIFFTFISFAPIFGFIFGIVSIIRQVKNEKNKLLISLSILGTIVSLALTVLMIVGIVFNK